MKALVIFNRTGSIADCMKHAALPRSQLAEARRAVLDTCEVKGDDQNPEYLCPIGSHVDIWDDQASCFQGLLPFLESLKA